MSRIPSYAYRVAVIKKPVGLVNSQQVENHNYTNLAGAIAYRDIALRRSNTKRVEVLMVLDESSPGHRE